MSIEDTLGFDPGVRACVVCGKNVERGGGFAEINHDGVKVNLCCPLCLETFQQDPTPHMARLLKAQTYHELKENQKGRTQ